MSKVQDSLVGEPGQYLSGGERRRLSLCMQLLSHKSASIFLLDEPVTGLVSIKEGGARKKKGGRRREKGWRDGISRFCSRTSPASVT
jgi:hypothetical protein